MVSFFSLPNALHLLAELSPLFERFLAGRDPHASSFSRSPNPNENAESYSGRLAGWIDLDEGIAVSIKERAIPAFKSNRVTLDVPADRWVVIPEVVVEFSV